MDPDYLWVRHHPRRGEPLTHALSQDQTERSGLGLQCRHVLFHVCYARLWPLVGWGKTEGSVFGWLYNNVMVALQGTMFSLLAFFVASAAYRAFRARTPEATVLLLSAILVMTGRVPLGEYLISWIGQVSDWIMNVPNTAAQRGILIGVSLGGIATSIKIICGIERAHLGEGKGS